MRSNLIFSLAVITLIAISLPSEGRRITLVPLSASEVYRLLREASREDAVPEGRVITQGIAAISGFALGLTKGIGGALLFDLATALFTAAANQNQTVTAQEVCFNSRSLDEIDDDDTPQGRQAAATGTGTVLTGAGTADYYITTNNGNVAYADGGNTGTQTYSTTQTGTGGEVTCVVVRKPTNSTGS